ncbi:Arf guanine nucleotide exchange factor sbh1 [Leucoagaricus gongylophorus]
MSDSDSIRSGRGSAAVPKPPGAQMRSVLPKPLESESYMVLYDYRRRAAAPLASRPNSTRAAGAGGSSNTMLKLYTDDSPGLRVDPFIVLVLSLSFIGSIFFLHISAKIVRAFTK